MSSTTAMEGKTLHMESNTQNQTTKPNPKDSKWFAEINDSRIPAPQRKVLVRVLKTQAGVPDSNALIRDHNSPNDVVLDDDATIDLTLGNVFYTVQKCDLKPRGECQDPPKLAFSVDDRVELTVRPDQSGKSLRDWFSIGPNRDLFRDFESPVDDRIDDDDAIVFADGPVFITRRQHVQLTITVNHKKFTEADGVKHSMPGRQIAALVSDNPDCTEVFRLGKGEPEGVPLDKDIRVENCDEFRVIRNNVAGGYERSRIERELKRLAEGGGRAEFFQEPFPAVIYRDVPTRPGYRHLEKTDVLVVVPGGYPGQPLDGAHLPEGSPLLGRVAGSPQGIVIAAGLRWQLVSYHPHNGGGAAPWNKDKHGLHTYFDEVLCWIHRANN